METAMVGSNLNSPNELRRALLLDAAASGAMGVLFLLAAGSLAALLGLPVTLVRYVGAFLIPFAAGLLWIATRSDVPAAVIRVIVFGNVLWVAASVFLLVSGVVSPTPLGVAVVLAQAAAVLVFAYLEYAGLTKHRGVARNA